MEEDSRKRVIFSYVSWESYLTTDKEAARRACSQNIETTFKLFGNLVLKASPSAIFGWRECVIHAESDHSTAISAMSAYRWPVVNDCERTDHYAALRW